MRRESGVSLIEMMVAMVVGMVAIVSIYEMSSAMRDYHQYNLGGSGAQMNSGVALMQLQTDLRQSGAGISHLDGLGCNVVSSQLATFPLVPVVIATPAGATSNSVTVLYGTKGTGMNFAYPVAPTHAVGDTQFSDVYSAISFLPGDMVVASNSSIAAGISTPCPLFQVTAVTTLAAIASCGASANNPTTKNLSVCHLGTSTWNNPQPFALDMSGSSAALTKLFDLGRMVRRTYCVYLTGNTNGCAGAPATLPDGALISMDAIDPNGAALPSMPLDGTWQVVAENVVQMKAEYGIDTSVPGNFSVTAWQTAAPATPAAWAQVVAVRLALLVRASNPQRPDSGGGCADRAAGPSPYAAATKADAFTNAAAAYYLGWSTANAGSQFTTPVYANWQCYRHSVNQTVVELRNMRSIIQSGL